MGDGSAKLIKLATLATMWRQCKALVEMKVDQQLKLHEDPNRIPEIAIMEYGAYRDAFITRHPETILTDWKEPNKRFLERLIRDLAIHQVVPPYEFGEVRLRSETIVQSSGIAASADLLLKVARVDVPASVTCEEDAIHRIHAFLVALEYVGQLAYGDFKGARGSSIGGSLTYLRELEHRAERRQASDSLWRWTEKSGRRSTSSWSRSGRNLEHIPRLSTRFWTATRSTGLRPGWTRGQSPQRSGAERGHVQTPASVAVTVKQP